MVITHTHTGIKIAIDESLDIVEARGLGFQQDRVDIYSNSWGPKDDGFTVEGPGTLVSMTFETGTKMVGKMCLKCGVVCVCVLW